MASLRSPQGFTRDQAPLGVGAHRLAKLADERREAPIQPIDPDTDFRLIETRSPRT